MSRAPRRGHFSRSRSLPDLDLRFNSQEIVEKTIEKALKKNKNVRVLEVGCGEGRVLLELRKLFPTIELHGINKNPWPAMKGEQSLKRTAVYYKIFTKDQINGKKNKVIMPTIHFYDAEKLKFKDNYFDLIISQVAVPYFIRKDLFLEEAWRVLKKGGVALMHLDTESLGSPDFLQCSTPRFVINHHGKPFPFTSFIAAKRKEGFGIRCQKLYRSDGYLIYNLMMQKNTGKRLKLGLRLDSISSFSLSKIRKRLSGDPVFWGYRSVFKM